MRRHSSLRNLSSDHHTALVQAQRLKRAAHADGATRRKIASDFLQFWEHHGQRHFCEEEQALLPFFARWSDLEQTPIQQMLREHAFIRRDVQLLQSSTEIATEIYTALGEQLEAHVRLEERVVFPLIEAALDEQTLTALLEALKKWHNANHL
jgi:iron-sulfur cluster repair protein YtfE (RIC family)